HFAPVHLAEFRFRANGLNHFQGFVARGCVFAVNTDVAVVVDVDRGAGGFGDAANRGAALADDFADLVGVDLDRGHARRVLRDRGTRRGDDFVHFVANVDTRLVGMLERAFHDLFGNALNLDVHLQCGNAFRGTGHFEV